MKAFLKIDLIPVVLITLFVAFIGCTEVIDVDLNSVNSKIVIDGSLTISENIVKEDNMVSVRISKTVDYFNSEEIPKISNAVVEISDSKGNVKTLEEKTPGLYQANVSGLNINYGEEYDLNVKTENETYTAKSILLKPLVIDSVGYETRKIFGTDQDIISVYFYDYPEQEDYAQIKVYQNGEPIILDQFALYSDAFVNGKNTDLQILLPNDTTTANGKNYKKGDNIEVELITFDKEAFQYYFILDDLVNVDVNKAVAVGIASPDNPITNLSNEALGFFGAYSISRKSIVLK